MNTKRTTCIPGILFLLALSLTANMALSQTTVQANFTWTAPTSGTPVDHYIVQHSINGGAWTQVATVTTNTYALAATMGTSHRVRVAGVDAASRQGPFSLPSTAFTPDPGAPSQPGKPILF